ncbi:ATP-binding protein [Limnobacter humi]|uniref:histidine kinase n=1 Tax=Limnobacter humi TaxID=1778671 RepID=A0ABT1WEI7_9BURK|nr:ATP-binding protein [Limnobacter humi]MCQ8895298.1 ATP-binding protein [Limnobacter humi]
MRTLFWKFFLAFWLCLFVAAGLTGVVLHALREDPSLRDLAEGPRAQFLLESTQAVLEGKGPDALKELLTRNHHRTGGPVPVYAVSEDGEELLDRAVPAELQARVQKALDAGDLEESGIVVTTDPDQTRWVLFIPKPKPPVPGDVAKPRKKPEPPLLPPMPWVNWLVVFVASMLFAGVLAYYFSRPLTRLRKAFRAASAGDLGVRLTDGKHSAGKGDEVGQLLQGFDLMAHELQLRINQQKALLHDVSHELRSPLARLNLATGLARQNPAQLEQSLSRIELEAERLDNLIDELLRLSRLDSGSQGEPEAEQDVMELLTQVVEDARFEAGSHGVEVLYNNAVEHWTAPCEPELLMRSFDNILRNAIKHSCAGQTILVAVAAHPTGLTVSIEDRGPGVPSELLSKIFDPFFKHGDKAGQGLGLAIAKRGIERHRGTLSAELVQPSGLRFIIVLPNGI